MTRLSGLSLSRTLAVIFIGVLAVSAIGVGAVTSYIQKRSVDRMAFAESERVAELIFQNLYSVMRKGWSREDIGEIIDRMNRTLPDVDIRVYRSRAVARQFGDLPADRAARDSDPVLARVLDSGRETMLQREEGIRFLYPAVATEACTGCHAVEPGTVNGVIDIIYPAAKLRVPLAQTVESTVWAFVAVFVLLFLALFLGIRALVVQPVNDLAGHMEALTESGDLDRRLAPRRRWVREVRSLADSFNQLLAALAASRRKLEEQSVQDPLTGLCNRRCFDDRLSHELQRARRYGHPCSVVMVDLDGFKPINDTHGHAAGDHLLVEVARLLEANVRDVDLVTRLGGDEFAIMAPDIDAAQAQALAEKLRRLIDGARFPFDGVELGVGASLGTATCPADGDDRRVLLAAADTAMYADKQRRKTVARSA